MLRMLPVRPQPGGYTIPQTTSDVESWDTYFAPDDDIHAVLLAELATANARLGSIPEVHSSQYGFTDQDIANQFAKLGVNPASRFLFDKTQEAGVKERPVVRGLVAQLGLDQWAIGTSSKAHQILHTKAVAILYPDETGWTMTGSFNLSASAENQFNVVDLVRSRSRAELFVNMIDRMFAWVKANEGANQP